MKYLPLLISWNFVMECRHNGTNVVSLPSGITSNMRKLSMTYTDLMKKSRETKSLILITTINQNIV
jgi:hypothetical protein